jgi:signal peptidase II
MARLKNLYLKFFVDDMSLLDSKDLKKIALLVTPIIIITVILDQWTKVLAERHINYLEVIPVIDGLFNLTLVYNKGAAFGIFSGLPDGVRQLVLGTVTFIALCAIIYLLIFEYSKSRSGQFALSLILGGALGNAIDRVFRGKVVDFLDFYYGTYHWPAFNVADSAITCGATALIFMTIFSKKKK